MRRTHCLVAATLLLLSWSTGALAQPYAGRSLTLPEAALRLDAGTRWPYPAGSLSLGLREPEPVHVRMGLSAGLTRDLELGALLLPVRLNNDAEYLDPSVHLLHRFGTGEVEPGLLVRASIPVQGDFVAVVGVPVRIHVAPTVRVDLGGFLLMAFPDRGTFASLLLPVELGINVTDEWFLGPLLGINVNNLIGDRDANTSIPLAFFGGYSWGVSDLRLQLDLGNLDDDVRATTLSFRVDLVF